MKWLFRIVRWGVFLVILLIIAVTLLWNPVLKGIAERSIRDQTGMNAEIGKFSVGIFTPTLTIRNLKLYNPPDFGGTPFLTIPELHVEYDRAALRKHILHITLLRLDLSEIDVVKNQAGRTNVIAILKALHVRKSGSLENTVRKATGFRFTGIDVLNISIGTARFINLGNQKENRWLNIDLQNQIIKNVKSPVDLAGLGALIWLRGGSAIGLPVIPPKHLISNHFP